METKKYSRLSYRERVIIATLLEEKKSKSYIAQKLGRSRSCIGNEINLWVKRPGDIYDARQADWYAREINREKRPESKILAKVALKEEVINGLRHHLSPELISGRLKLSYPLDGTMQLSHESIYKWIYTHRQSRVGQGLIKLLTRKKSRRGWGKKREKAACTIKGGVSIELRPESVEDRLEVGHWEGDLLIGEKQQSCIGSLVERKTRYVILVKPESKKSETVCKAFGEKLAELPLLYRKSMTYDNGTEMSEHKQLSGQTGMDIYFAHPYSSWERGTNENTNGLVRRFYPKKTDFNKVSKGDLEHLQDHLNDRPRKVLGYYTPKEMYQYELLKGHKGGNDNLVLEMGNKPTKGLFSFLMPKLE